MLYDLRISFGIFDRRLIQITLYHVLIDFIKQEVEGRGQTFGLLYSNIAKCCSMKANVEMVVNCVIHDAN